MSHLALYREWRPQIFDEVVEQKQVVHALRQSVISGQINHAYLFSGTRGTGKTTLAKIFARAINCLEPRHGNPCNECQICRAALDGSLLDIVEMDAASNNSVDNIRRVCDEVVFLPSQARYKVYIIDEVHMLSTGAFNALLKTLEEPPAHAVFILATTEAHRIPATIISRCQRYEFRRIPQESMVAQLEKIARQDDISITPEALTTIAALADGALRDAISILDQARAAFTGPVSHDDVLSLVGVVKDQFLQEVTTAILEIDVARTLLLVEQLVMSGRDIGRFVTDLAQHLRDILVCQMTDDDRLLVRVNSQALLEMKSLAERIPSSRLIELIRSLSALLSDLRYASDARTTLEIALIRLMGAEQIKELPRREKTKTQLKSATKEVTTAALPVELQEKAVQPEPKQKEPGPQAPMPETQAAPQARPAAPLPEPPLPEPPPEETDWTADLPLENPAASPVKQQAAEPAKEQLELWAKTLAALEADGQMTLYLFARQARAQLQGDTLKLIFAEKDQVNYQEISQPEAKRTIQAQARRLAGRELTLVTELLTNANQPEIEEDQPSSWVDKVRQVAAELDIPFREQQ